MAADGFIDLSQEGGYWRWHRLTAPILFVLLVGHLWGRLVHPDSGFLNGPYLLVPLAGTVIFHVTIGIRHLLRLCPIFWPKPGRRHFLTWAIAAERWCGVALAIFLALHLCLIALSLTLVPTMEHLLKEEGGPLVDIAESFLSAILAYHTTGGLRVLIEEGFDTHRHDRQMARLAVVLAILAPFVLWTVRSM